MESKFVITSGCSIGNAVLGVVLQLIAAFVFMMLPDNLYKIALFIIKYSALPLGLFGIVLGIKAMRAGKGRFLPVFGIVLNVFWILAVLSLHVRYVPAD